VTHGEASIDGPRPKDVLSRTYKFSGLPPPDTAATVRIECIIESAGLRSEPDGSSGVSLNRSVRFYLRPFRLPHEAEFVLRVIAVDGSEGGDFDVLARPVDGETAVFAGFGGRNDTAALLRTLMAGKDLKFEVLQGEESLVKLPLQSDGAFKRLWGESANRFAEIETVYDVLRSQHGQAPQPETYLAAEVRKNPKWQVERGSTGVDGPRPKDVISRTYQFSGLPQPDATATLRIECTIESAGLMSGSLRLNRSVQFRFQPFRL
jgi:hypothetical protein